MHLASQPRPVGDLVALELDGNYLEVSATTPPRKKLRAHICNNGSDEWCTASGS